jgi:hypothetical protein
MAYLLSVAAGVPPAVESGILPLSADTMDVICLACWDVALHGTANRPGSQRVVWPEAVGLCLNAPAHPRAADGTVRVPP